MFFVAGLLGFHVFLLMGNTTTHEYFCKVWESPKNNPFDIGVTGNLREICCFSSESEGAIMDRFQVLPENIPMNSEASDRDKHDGEINEDGTSEHSSAKLLQG